MLATTFEVGSRLEVEEGGVWYPVRVTHVDESRVCIHFEGWSQRYDKWLEKDSENIRVLRKQHTMKRRSRATDDSERPPKRASATLKVGGVFLAGARKSTRKSTDAQKDSNGRNNGGEIATSTPTSSRNSSQVQNANNNSKTSRDSKERNSTRSLRETKEKETKSAAVTPTLAVVPTPIATSAPGPAAVLPVKGVPPVGWAYEVVTSAQDLVPKKAFTINADHNDFKCTQENCNKSFRKEKLLQSHLKHYHNVNVEAPESPSPASSTPQTLTPTPNAAATPVSSDSRRRRPLARRTRNAAEEERQLDKLKDAETIAESSSSTDISNVTVIDTVEATPSGAPSEETTALLPANDSVYGGSPREKSPETSALPQQQPSGSAELTSPSTGTPASRTPLYGRVGQNRFVLIPEPLVLGREKRKVVKTERMQEAESTFIRKQKAEAGTGQVERKEKRRRSHVTEKEDTERQQGVTLAKPEAPSDDETTISSPKCPAASDPKPAAEPLVEKDMVHCPCGVEEESGLMMQCDLCLCWQHGSCFGLENEKHVPERYVCIACQNARRVLQKQCHQVAAFRAMTEGRLPSLVPASAGHTQRFLNLTKIAETMADLRKALRGIEIRMLRVYQDNNRSLPERQILLDAAVADADCIQRQMETCEKILAAIDKPSNDQGSEALILRSTVKSVLKDLWTVQRLTLFR